MVYFVGVDVGTGSARAALVAENGRILKVAVKEIRIWNSEGVFYEQSSDDVWNSCVFCIRKVIENIDPSTIKGIGFDATCSLVAIDHNDQPISISRSGNNSQNIIMWLDHRASKEAEEICRLNHDVLKFTGGKISLEMQTPKLMWLKRNLKEQCWDKVKLFLDLPDFLTWKATGSDSRSLCSLVCKWTYEVCDDGRLQWNKSYFSQIGLEDLLDNNAAKIGNKVYPPGTRIAGGLSKAAAEKLGLMPGTSVGTSIIDAHSGGLALLGCSVDGIDPEFHTKIGLICGTSTCHMAVTKAPIYAKGIWGPYFGAMVPEMWLNEGGQSVTGKLLDHVLDSHPAAKSIKTKLTNMHLQEYLNKFLMELAESRKVKNVCYLAEDLHVWPDFHGNRSPIADPTLKGAICGLTLSSDEESLALLYLATVQALCYGTRHILETLKSSGNDSIKSILICGGLSKNPLFNQTQADVVRLPVVFPDEKESVLLGAAMLGACAAGFYPDTFSAITAMGGSGTVIRPDGDVKDFHDRKYRVFLSMLEHQNLYREIMRGKL